MNTEISTLPVILADNTAPLLQNVPVVCQQIWYGHDRYLAHPSQTVRTYVHYAGHWTWKERLGDIDH
jgi:hypothetical protein